MSRDQTSSEDRLQKLRLILRTMEEAVDDAKSRRTADAPTPPDASDSPRIASSSSPSTDSSADASPTAGSGLHGRGRDIPGPDSLPRAKARPKGFRGFSDGGSPLGRTG